MARVPTTGIFEMFSSANSIHQVLVTEFGYSGALDFASMIAWCKANVDISYFDPRYRPQLLSNLNQTLHFRGLPQPNALISCGTYIDYQTDGSLTGTPSVIVYNGQEMPYEQLIDLGTGRGIVYIDYYAGNIPDKFILEWEGQEVVNTGYVGSTGWNTSLNNAVGETVTENNVGWGVKSFHKNSGTNLTKLKVFAPLSNTGWVVRVRCPQAMANYVFSNTLTFSKGSLVNANVDTVIVNESNQNGINIGQTGVDISASYNPTAADITALNGGTLYLELTIKESSSAGTQIYNQIASVTTQANLSVNRVIATTEFNSHTLYVEVKIYDVQGGGGQGGGEDPINPD